MFCDNQVREVEWLLDSELYYLERKTIFCESWTLVKYSCGCLWNNKTYLPIMDHNQLLLQKKIPFHIYNFNLLPKLCR